MTPDIEALEEALRQKEAELLKNLCRREDILVEYSADVLEQALSAQAREQAAYYLNRTSELLTEVRLALKRLTDGEFGICLRCDGDIAPQRLRAIPWTTLCRECQEHIDGQNSRFAA